MATLVRRWRIEYYVVVGPKTSAFRLQATLLWRGLITWVLVKGFHLSYHKKETVLFTIDPYYGNLNYIP